VLGVRARILCDDGSIAYIDERHTPTLNYNQVLTYHELRAGVLLDFSVFVFSGTVKRGNLYVLVSLADRFQPVPQRTQPISKGYVSTAGPLIWPHGATYDPAEGPGYLTLMGLSSPSVGVDFSFTVPVGVRWNLISFVGTLVTSAVAGTRVPSMVIDDGSSIAFTLPYPTGQAASLTYTYYWENIVYALGLVGTNVFVPVTNIIPLLSGWRLRTSTALLDSGDQWSAMRVAVLTWVEP
jgi:hypothetical protein